MVGPGASDAADPGLTAACPVVATGTASALDILGAVERLAGRWLYFGRSYARLKGLAASLPGGLELLDVAESLESVAMDLRGPYSDWIDTLGGGHGADLAWMLGGVASRNAYTSELLCHVCCLELVRRLLASGEAPVLIVTESAGLAKALATLLAEHGRPARMLGRPLGAGQTPLRRDLWRIWRAYVGLFRQRLRAYNAHKDQLPPPPLGAPAVLVDTFLHADSFPGSARFHDRYHPRLRDYLARRGLPVLVHFTPDGVTDFDALYQGMARSDAMFLCPERHLRPSDYLIALLQPWRYARHQRRMPGRFRGLDVSSLWGEAFRRTLEVGILPMLIYRLVLRLRQSGVRISHVIDWNENQPIDKALTAAVRRAYPRAHVSGVQMFFHSPNCPGLFPSPLEVEAGLAPDVLLGPGRAHCRVARQSAPSMPCRPAASLRHAHVFAPSASEEMDWARRREVLVLLPNMLDDAAELVDKVRSVLDAIPQGFRVVCKIHPDCDRHELARWFGASGWPAPLEPAGGSLESLAASARVALASGTSSVVEVAARGVPVLMWGRTASLSMDVETGVDSPLLVRCFQADQARAFLRRWLSGGVDGEALRAEGSRLRELCFTPEEEPYMAAYLGEGPAGSGDPIP